MTHYFSDTPGLHISVLKLKLQEKLQLDSKKELIEQIHKRNPERIAALRKTFLERAMSYVGTPYARKYHDVDCELYVFNYLTLCVSELAAGWQQTESPNAGDKCSLSWSQCLIFPHRHKWIIGVQFVLE